MLIYGFMLFIDGMLLFMSRSSQSTEGFAFCD